MEKVKDNIRPTFSCKKQVMASLIFGFLGGVGAEFSSKRDFGSGYFRMKIKIPEKNSKGLITSFYVNDLNKHNH